MQTIVAELTDEYKPQFGFVLTGQITLKNSIAFTPGLGVR